MWKIIPISHAVRDRLLNHVYFDSVSKAGSQHLHHQVTATIK